MNAIVRRCPAQRLRVDRGVVQVYSRFARHAGNILNLRISRFQVKNESVFDAEHELELTIDMELHPSKYAGGYNGGSGYPTGDIFAIPNVSFSGRDINVRDVLNGIVRSNGNALWVVRLSSASLNQRVPLGNIYKNWEAILRIWEFLPLKDTR